MSEKLIPVADLASQFGKRKQTVFKVLRRLRIGPKKLRSSDRGGQLVSYITARESGLVAAELRSAGPGSKPSGGVAAQSEALPDEHGVFYLLLPEAEHDPGG